MKKLKELYADYSVFIWVVLGVYLFFAWVRPLLLAVVGPLLEKASSVLDGTYIPGTQKTYSEEEKRQFETDALAVSRALNTHKDSSWYKVTEDEHTANIILKKYGDGVTNRFHLLQPYYSKFTGGKSLVNDVIYAFDGQWAKYLGWYGL